MSGKLIFKAAKDLKERNAKLLAELEELAEAADRIAQLERELAEEKRDAEIGRWFLRKTSYIGESDGLQYAFMGKCFGPSSLSPTTLREAIEELMKEEK